MSRFKYCLHCLRQVGEGYMVKDEVWQRAGFGRYDGVLHLACLETLIERPLVIADFTDAPINDAVRFGITLAHRDF